MIIMMIMMAAPSARLLSCHDTRQAATSSAGRWEILYTKMLETIISTLGTAGQLGQGKIMMLENFKWSLLAVAVLLIKGWSAPSRHH